MKRRRTEQTDSLMGPKISSILPIWVLLCRYIGALKKGIFSYVSFVTASPSHAWTNDETSARTQKKKKKTITLFTPKASLFQQNTNHNHETKRTYDFGRWALVTKATASTMTTKMATSKKKPLISMFLTSAASPSFFSFLLSKFHASLPFFVTVSLPKFFNYPRFFLLPTVMGGISNGW